MTFTMPLLCHKSLSTYGLKHSLIVNPPGLGDGMMMKVERNLYDFKNVPICNWGQSKFVNKCMRGIITELIICFSEYLNHFHRTCTIVRTNSKRNR